MATYGPAQRRAPRTTKRPSVPRNVTIDTLPIALSACLLHRERHVINVCNADYPTVLNMARDAVDVKVICRGVLLLRPPLHLEDEGLRRADRVREYPDEIDEIEDTDGRLSV